jgi:RNA polymerase sigma-70 factor (ECF subfamily)
MEMAFDATSGADDDDLIARYAAGDQSAARALALRHTPRVLAIARRMLADAAEAEDVAQEAMLRLWKTAPDWRPGEAKVSTWLHRVASNLCIDILRKRRRLSAEEAPETADDAPSALTGMEQAERATALRDAMDALPDRQRAAVTMRHFAGLSNPEIGEKLGVSVEAVESLLARGRRALARRLAPQRQKLGLG